MIKLQPHSGQTQAQFDAIIAGNYVNRVQAGYAKPKPFESNTIAKTEFRAEGASPRCKHIVDFHYTNGSVKSFDGVNWTTLKA